MTAKTVVGSTLLVFVVGSRLIGRGERISSQLKLVVDDTRPRIGLAATDDTSLQPVGVVQSHGYHKTLVRPRAPKCACVIWDPPVASMTPPWWPGRGHVY